MSIQHTLAGSFILLLAISTGLGQPVITQQPTNQSVSLGARGTFAVNATEDAPMKYQWRLNALDLPNATNRSLVLTNVQLTSAGDYAVVVANSSGSVTSQVAHLDVDTVFTKITAGSIVNNVAASLHCAWGDYDNDGFLERMASEAIDREWAAIRVRLGFGPERRSWLIRQIIFVRH